MQILVYNLFRGSRSQATHCRAQQCVRRRDELIGFISQARAEKFVTHPQSFTSDAQA